MTVEAADPAPPTDPPAPARPARRGAAGAIGAVAILAAVTVFYRLGDDAMHGDESQYALATRDVVDRGNWLAPSPYPPTLWFHKPPLYMWLSAALAPVTGDGPVRYRAWSAAFAVGAVVVTMLLARRVFGATAAAVLAGLVLLTNQDLVYHHGAREGTMDTGLTFLTVVVAYLLTRVAPAHTRSPSLAVPRSADAEPRAGARQCPQSQETGLHRWAVVGALLGVMSLLKPLAGVPLWLLLAVAAGSGATGLDARSRRRALLGSLVALAVMTAVAGPWYLACWFRYGGAFVDGLFGANLAGRIGAGMGPEPKPWHYYAQLIPGGSPLFALAVVAVPYVAWRGWRDLPAARLVAVLAVGWPVLFSLSAGKAAQYVYPALPMIAVCVAGTIVAAARRWLPPARAPLAARAVLTHLAVLVAAGHAVQFWRHLSRDLTTYPAADLYAQVAPAVAGGDADLAVLGLPADQAHWRGQLMFDARDCFYLEPVARAATITDPLAYQAAVAGGRRVFAVVARAVPRPADMAVTVAHEAPAFVVEHAGLDEYVPVAAESTPVQLRDEPFAQRFALQLRPPARAAGRDVRIAIELDLNAPARARVRWNARHAVTKDKIAGPWYLVPTPDGHHLLATIEPADWDGPMPMPVEFSLRDDDRAASAGPVTGRVREARLIVER